MDILDLFKPVVTILAEALQVCFRPEEVFIPLVGDLMVGDKLGRVRLCLPASDHLACVEVAL